MSVYKIPSRDPDGNILSNSKPFASKKIPEGSLFKRVHGVAGVTIPANSVGYLTLVIPYALCKFTGATILNTEIGDKVDFLVLDTPTNTISGLDPETYGANYPLNQFGFNVNMKNGAYQNTSEYDADLIQNMELMCVYYNNSNSSKTVYMNTELHEVKA